MGVKQARRRGCADSGQVGTPSQRGASSLLGTPDAQHHNDVRVNGVVHLVLRLRQQYPPNRHFRRNLVVDASALGVNRTLIGERATRSSPRRRLSSRRPLSAERSRGGTRVAARAPRRRGRPRRPRRSPRRAPVR